MSQENTTKFSFPTETVELPSKGLLYPKDNPLSSGTIEMKYMTAREEDILTNVNLLKQGVAIDRVLQALIKSPINYEELLLCDKNAILISARILAYGKDYTFGYVNPNTEQEEKITIDLSKFENKEVDYSLFNNTNEFSFTLPHSKNTLTFKMLSHADSKKIDAEVKGLKKIGNGGELTTRLKYQILSVNGDYEQKTIREFVDNYLLSIDSNALRQYISSITPDLNLNLNFTLSDGTEVKDLSLPFELDFFFPGSRL
jgi:hypothetical protein